MAVRQVESDLKGGLLRMVKGRIRKAIKRSSRGGCVVQDGDRPARRVR